MMTPTSLSDPIVKALARALCDTSSHVNLMPHADQRPCRYHLDRALAALRHLARDRIALGVNLPDRPPLPLNPKRDADAERSRLDAENLRARVPPIHGRVGGWPRLDYGWCRSSAWRIP